MFHIINKIDNNLFEFDLTRRLLTEFDKFKNESSQPRIF